MVSLFLEISSVVDWDNKREINQTPGKRSHIASSEYQTFFACPELAVSPPPMDFSSTF